MGCRLSVSPLQKGPGSRAQCLAAGLHYLKGQPRHVLIHDIRRPLAPEGIRDRVIAGLRAGSSVVMPVLAVTDSVKAVDASGSVTGTLDRSSCRRCSTRGDSPPMDWPGCWRARLR